MTNLKKPAAILTICFFACHFVALRVPVVDMDRSGAVDLFDAIMAVQTLHRFTEDFGDQETGGAVEFGVSLFNTVEVFKVLAGMKTFSPVKPLKAVQASASFIALIPTLSVDYDLPMTLIPETRNFIYHSYEPEPSTPPPKSC